MPYKEKEIVKKYYSIGEVAQQLNVTTSLIRFWEGEFGIIKPKKNRNGNRQFTTEDIDNIKLIYHLVKEKGFTLQGARDILKKNPNDAKKKMEMLESLKELRAFLLELKNQLP
jgi:DNA-binding transcriptional MerR regulator